MGEMGAARYDAQRWERDDPFSRLCAFQQAGGDELILLTFSAMATTLTSGRHRVVISYLSCVQSSVEAEAKDGGLGNRGRLVQRHGGRGCANGGGIGGRCGGVDVGQWRGRRWERGVRLYDAEHYLREGAQFAKKKGAQSMGEFGGRGVGELIFTSRILGCATKRFDGTLWW
jgi:hypothetical protein